MNVNELLETIVYQAVTLKRMADEVARLRAEIERMQQEPSPEPGAGG